MGNSFFSIIVAWYEYFKKNPYYLGIYLVETFSYLPNKITLVSIWFRVVVNQIIIRVYKDSLILIYPPKFM